MLYVSPLRYPGGKRKLSNFVKIVYRHNDLLDGQYVEPYAGGASVALSLLYGEYVRKIHINDIDKSVYSFWYAAVNHTEELCKLINDTPVTIDEWRHQKAVQHDRDADTLALGFSTFFLNRTNRSGIISGGVIGGKAQTGGWLIDARFNRSDLISRVQKVARYRSRIHLYNLDALSLLTTISTKLTDKSLIYLDPPYFIKGQQQLYVNFYNPNDHENVRNAVQALNAKWIVSYDDVSEIRILYQNFRYLQYGLNYSAQDRYNGAEIMFFCDDLEIPDLPDPTKIKGKVLQQFLL